VVPERLDESAARSYERLGAERDRAVADLAELEAEHADALREREALAAAAVARNDEKLLAETKAIEELARELGEQEKIARLRPGRSTRTNGCSPPPISRWSAPTSSSRRRSPRRASARPRSRSWPRPRRRRPRRSSKACAPRGKRRGSRCERASAKRGVAPRI